MKPPLVIDQGWSLVAGALANRGVHPPPTTSRPSLASRCGCTPDCLRSPRPAATPLAGFQSLSSPSSTRTQEGCKVTGETPRSPRSFARSLALSSPFLPRTTSSEADLPRGQPPSVNDDALPPRESTRKTTATPAHAPAAFPTQPRPSLSLESPQGPLGSPGLTLQGAVCDHGEALLAIPLLPFFLLLSLLFFFTTTSSSCFRGRRTRLYSAIDKII